MMVLWEEKSINVKELGNYLFLDSGTLTPLLKKLEQKKYITRQRLHEDERNVIVSVTEEGLKLRDEALDVPRNVGKCVNIDKEDARQLFILLHKVMENFYKSE
jgi:DNA-binding MarR family transcriptional regulator